MNVPNVALIQSMIELGQEAKDDEQLKRLLVIAYNEGAVWGLRKGRANKYGKPTGMTKKLMRKALSLIEELRDVGIPREEV